jgi:hypothetical protein
MPKPRHSCPNLCMFRTLRNSKPPLETERMRRRDSVLECGGSAPLWPRSPHGADRSLAGWLANAQESCAGTCLHGPFAQMPKAHGWRKSGKPRRGVLSIVMQSPLDSFILFFCQAHSHSAQQRMKSQVPRMGLAEKQNEVVGRLAVLSTRHPSGVSGNPLHSETSCVRCRRGHSTPRPGGVLMPL